MTDINISTRPEVQSLLFARMLADVFNLSVCLTFLTCLSVYLTILFVFPICFSIRFICLPVCLSVLPFCLCTWHICLSYLFGCGYDMSVCLSTNLFVLLTSLFVFRSYWCTLLMREWTRQICFVALETPVTHSELSKECRRENLSFSRTTTCTP